MRSGRLPQRVTIQIQDNTQNTHGEVVEGWTDAISGKIWAGVEPISSNEVFSEDERNAELATRIVIRYRENLGPFVRFLHKNRTYYAQGQPIDKNSEHKQLEYICYERS